MKRLGRAASRLAILASATILLVGCPLVSDYPLSDPKASRVNQALLGQWMVQDAEAKEKKLFTFLPFDEHELIGFAQGDEAGAIEAYRAFTTEIEGESFLNIRELGKAAPGWYILRYRTEGPRLVLTLVDDNLFENRSFAGSAELLEYLRLNISNPKLYAPKDDARGDMIWERAPLSSLHNVE